LLQQRVSSAKAEFGSLEENLPKLVGLLTDGLLVVVVSRKRIKASELHPSGTELFRGILIKTTNIGSNHLDSEYLE
jgi:hypothetical protein